MHDNSETESPSGVNSSTGFSRRSTFVAILLAIELSIAATACQHSGTLVIPFDTIWWIRALAQPDLLTRIFVTFCIAVLLFCGRDLARKIQSSSEKKQSPLVEALLIFCHICCLIGVVGTSQLTEHTPFEKFAPSVYGPPIWLTCFLGLIGSVAVFLLPVSDWVSFIRENKASFWVAILVGVSAWGGGFFSLRLWKFLGPATLEVVDFLLSINGWQTVHGEDPFNIGIDSFTINIAAQCSGYEGIGLMFSFTSGYLWISRNRLKFPNSFILIPATLILIWLANALRIAVLILIGAKGYPEVAVGGFHSQAGWIAFNIIGLGAVYLINTSSFFSKQSFRTSDRHTAQQTSEAVPYLLPFLSLLFVAMLTKAISSDFDWLYPVRVIVAGGLLLKFRKYYPSFRISLVAIIAGIIVFIVWATLERAQESSGPPETLLSISRPTRYMWLLFRALGFCIVIPLAEELAFRGYLMRRLIGENVAAIPIGTYSLASLLISSALFGFLHGQWLGGIFAGAIYAFALYYRSNLSDAITAHAVTNSSLMIFAVCTGKWGVWL